MLQRQMNSLQYSDYITQIETWPDGVKYELISGETFLMTGGSPDHDLIKGNVYSLMKKHFPECYITTGDANLRAECINEENGYFPDCMIVCSKEGKKDKYYDMPVVIIEVVSPGSQYLDKAKKKTDYMQLPTLELYLMVEAFKKEIIGIIRTGMNHWTEIEIREDQAINIKSASINIIVDDLYHQTNL